MYLKCIPVKFSHNYRPAYLCGTFYYLHFAKTITLKNWTPEDWLKYTGLCIVGAFLIGYLVGIFVLNQPTNDTNKDLRMAMVILLTTIVNNVFNQSKKDKL